MLCRLYALVRMVEVVLTNLQRIDQLWPIFLSHVMELLSHPKASIRNAAVDALAKAVVGALSHVNALAEGGHEKVHWLLMMMLITLGLLCWQRVSMTPCINWCCFWSSGLHQCTVPGQTPLEMQVLSYSCPLFIMSYRASVYIHLFLSCWFLLLPLLFFFFVFFFYFPAFCSAACVSFLFSTSPSCPSSSSVPLVVGESCHPFCAG